MGIEDRAYSRRSGAGGWGILQWLLSGSMPLFRVAGVTVRMHASMVVFIGLTLLLGGGIVNSLEARVTSMTMLFGLVLLHEFGHVFACRAVGGTADEILMHPLGGLAYASPPRRWLPSLITTVGGPAVNLGLLMLAAVVCYAVGGRPPWNPFSPRFEFLGQGEMFAGVYRQAAWFFLVNYYLLLFNLIPSFPLDGGRILQETLWPFVGYYRSMMIAVTLGMVGAVGFGVWGLATGSLLLAVLGFAFCLPTCLQMRAQLRAAGPWAFQDEENYAAASWKPDQVERPSRSQERASRRAEARAAADAARDAAEQAKIDRILAKVHQQGMHSLNFLEKRALRKATERQRHEKLRRRR